ncbi:unnamed protein product [Clonostachys rosea f. rosea IK726]|uniref:FAD-binding PCMH-type domain-containing protein n=2 Tax=Bionectria ochroleuca TaxID=29856 RepID=A0A0B7KC08_BIOOC|nr:unnamed protein product [Clonostachys rosea f. rosea IK726]
MTIFHHFVLRALLLLLLLETASYVNAYPEKNLKIRVEKRISEEDKSTKCRCFPGDACWPTQEEWNALNQSVGGRLVATVPIGSVCHGSTTYNAEKCANLKAAWNVPETHTDTSSSVLAPFFANQSCDPFLPRDSQCVIGTYVQYAIDVANVSHIQRALSFAKKKNLRFVIRNTGHDYFGKSTGAGALSVWTHHLKSFDLVDFTSSFYTGKAIKVGSGIQGGEILPLAFKQGYAIVAGVCPTVGPAGGFTQGGGLGPLTSKHGFGADQVLEWQVVLTDGTFVTATPEKYTDLYWALSGGGGGAYGVVYSVTIKAHPNELTTAANLTFANTGASESFFEGVKAFTTIVPSLTDVGGTALWTVRSGAFSLAPATAPGVSKKTIDALFEPVLKKLEALNITYSYSSTEFQSYYESYLAYNPPASTPGIQIGGRLLPRSVITDNIDGLIETIRSIVGYGAAVTGVAYKAPSTPAVPNAVNPELRNSLVSLQVGTLWNTTDWAANIKNQNLITNTLVPSLAKLIPGGGSAYLNQADFREPKWQQTFYGVNYNTLLCTKNKYDPNGIFWGNTVVGSEKWKETDDKRLCRVSS